jgi:natural product biosynthesis luciferase-like monooxygenase protein
MNASSQYAKAGPDIQTLATAGPVANGGKRRPLEFSLLYFSSNEAEFSEDKYRLMIEGAKFADTHDFTAVWLPERHFHPFGGLYPNPSVLASALAMVTERVRLRAGSVVLPMHHPVRVAEEWAVVDNLSGGRVDLSLAAGWNPSDFVLAPGSFADRYHLLFSGLDTIRLLWGGGTVELTGGLGQPVPVRIYPQPQQPALATWITCSGGRERFVQAGEHGANVLTALLFQGVAELAGKIAAYREARARHGLDPATGHVTLMLHTFMGDDLEEVRRIVQAPFIEYLESSMNLWRNGSSKPDDMRPREREALLARAFRRYFRTSALFGTQQTCAAFVTSLQEAGVDEIACLIDFGIDLDTTIRGLHELDALRKHMQTLSVVSQS